MAEIKEVAEEKELQSFLSEDYLAERFVIKHQHELRYVAKWGQWLRFADGRWCEEPTLLAFDLARKVCRVEAAKANNKGRAISSAKTIAAIERIAKADRAIAATVDQWDTDPWLLNTPKGTVDLKTGKIRPHDSNDYITKITTVSPGGKCLTWKKHLKRILPDDEVVDFLQRYFGYSLSGDTTEDQWCFATGTGRNGKDTTIETIAGILGEYHKSAPIETFTISRYEQHPTDLAMLRGARLVTSNEVEAGKLWAEAKIKRLTGGGTPIPARFMKQDFFHYHPQFKLFISGNHKPHFRSVDEAMKARVNLILFGVTIPENERDPDFPDKLRPEWPGILAWMIEGCLEWQRDGLKVPKVIRDATKEYLDEEQGLGEWIKECCVLNVDAWTETKELFDCWKAYRKETNQFICTERAFIEMLIGDKDFNLRRGLHSQTRRSGFNGLKLQPLAPRSRGQGDL